MPPSGPIFIEEDLNHYAVDVLGIAPRMEWRSTGFSPTVWKGRPSPARYSIEVITVPRRANGTASQSLTGSYCGGAEVVFLV